MHVLVPNPNIRNYAWNILILGIIEPRLPGIAVKLTH